MDPSSSESGFRSNITHSTQFNFKNIRSSNQSLQHEIDGLITKQEEIEKCRLEELHMMAKFLTLYKELTGRSPLYPGCDFGPLDELKSIKDHQI